MARVTPLGVEGLGFHILGMGHNALATTKVEQLRLFLPPATASWLQRLEHT